MDGENRLDQFKLFPIGRTGIEKAGEQGPGKRLVGTEKLKKSAWRLVLDLALRRMTVSKAATTLLDADVKVITDVKFRFVGTMYWTCQEDGTRSLWLQRHIKRC